MKWNSIVHTQMKFYWNAVCCLLDVVCGGFHATVVQMSSWDRKGMAHNNAQNIYCLALYGKSLPILGLHV